MPGVFLSHSSKDKTFVVKLAIDLLNRGFPVWLDNWEIELGDGVAEGISQGIDQSHLVLLILSPDSVQSDWVKQELTTALRREKDINRKFVIPVLARECEVPVEIRDRLSSRLVTDYLAGVEALCTQLEEWGADKIHVDPTRQIIPLRFERDVFLDRVALNQRLEHLAPPLIQDDELVNLPSLVARLRRRERNFDVWLAEGLSTDSKAALANYPGDDSALAPLRTALMRDLNQVLSGSLIREAQRFAGIDLRSATERLLLICKRGGNVARANRLLLEDAYPNELSRKHNLAAGGLGFTVSPTQLLVEPGGTYTHLRTLATSRRDNLKSDPYFSPEFFERFTRDYRSLTRLEDQLAPGVATLLNQLYGRGDLDAVDACYWYARNIRSELIRYFCAMQNPDAADSVEQSPEWTTWMQGAEVAARFFGVDSVEQYKVGQRDEQGGLEYAAASVFLPSDCRLARYLDAHGGSESMVPLVDFGHPEMYSKYLAPQILFQHQHFGNPLRFNFSELWVCVP